MKTIFSILFLIIIGSILYSLTLRGISGNPRGSMIKNNLDQATKPFELSPERGRFILTMSLAENKSFALNDELANAAYPDVGYYKGHYFIYFAPGISLLTLPFYLIGKHYNLAQIASFSTISFFAILNLIFVYLISKKIFKLPTYLSLLVSIIFGFGSTSWSYAITMYQHHVTTFFILSSFYAVWKFRQGKSFSWLWALYAWLAYGFAVSIDYPNAIFLFPILVYLLISSFQISRTNSFLQIKFKLSSILTSVALVLVIVLNGYFNYINFGSYLKVSGALASAKSIQEQQLLKTPQGQAKIQELQQSKKPIEFFHEDRFPRSFSILLFARDKGLFLFAPIFLLAFLGIFVKMKENNLEKYILLASAGTVLFLYSSWGDPWGGWAYGPRYLIPTMAILSIFIGVWLNITKHKIASKIITFILFSYSSAIALLGALTTNQVPPKIEADFLHMKYNFLLNIDYLLSDRSGSFFYNQFASRYMNLVTFFSLIFYSLLLIVIILLFVVPYFERNEPINKYS